MKYIKTLIATILLMTGISVSAEPLRAGISIDEVPKAFYGSWRVVAKIDKQTGNINFKPQAIDFWNLSRVGDVIKLDNPFTGASATVKVDYVEGDMIRFTKTGQYDGNKQLTDTVDLRLNGDTFTGVNYLNLETFSAVDGSTIVRKDTATYILKGEKISGSSIVGK